MSAAPAHPPDPIEEWLHHLYGAIEDGWLTIFSINPDDGSRHTDWAPTYQLDAAADMARNRATTSNVWFGVATRTERLHGGKRGGDTDCDLIPALWLDIDIAGEGHQTTEPLPTNVDEALQLLDDFPLPPTAVIHSGHGLQAWWLLDEAVPATEAAQVLPRWGHTWAGYAKAHRWHLDNVFDVARIMRLPGTHNRKADPRPVDHLATRPPEWGRRYGLEQLNEWLEDPPPPPERDTTPRVPYIGPDRPGDAFNATHSGADVLEMLGFHSPRRKSNGDVDYVRPGKDARKGASATVYADDDHVTIWSETCRGQWPDLKIRHGYRPFQLLVATNYRGDFTAAARELRAHGYGGTDAVDAKWLTDEVMANVHLPEGTDEHHAPDDLDDGWSPVDWATVLAEGYEPPKPTILRRTDGAHLLYGGRVNGFFGESGSGKSWMALLTCAQQIKAGGTVLYVDLEDHAGSIAARLTALGVTRDQIVDRFVYLSPSIAFGDSQAARVDEMLDTLDIGVAVVDSTGEAMALDGAKPNDDDDTARWIRRLPKRLARTGAAVVLIDHVPKDPENRGKPIGSQRKIAAVDGALYSVEVKVAPARGTEGKLVLKCAKDRNGTYARGATVGDVIVDSVTEAVHISIRPHDVAERPTFLMERVSRHLELEGATSLADIKRGVKGNNEAIARAVEFLVADGNVEQATRPGRGGGFLFSVKEPYREPASETQEVPEWYEDGRPEPRPTAPGPQNVVEHPISVTESDDDGEQISLGVYDGTRMHETDPDETAPNRARTAPRRGSSGPSLPPETAPRPLEGARFGGRSTRGDEEEENTRTAPGAVRGVPDHVDGDAPLPPPPAPVLESSGLFGGPCEDDDDEGEAT